jgi:hypothetical protein
MSALDPAGQNAVGNAPLGNGALPGHDSPPGNRHHDLPGYTEPGLTQDCVLRDVHVAASRPAGQQAKRHMHLTSDENLRLFMTF